MVAPVVTTSSSTTTLAPQGVQAIDAGLTITDVDSANLSGASVSITSGFAGSEDVLGFLSQNGITGSYNTATGVLTLTGTASVANYQTALDSVTYSDTNASPTGLSRTISFSATDDTAAASNTATKALTPSVPAAPVATPTPADVEAMFATLTGVALGDAKVLSPTITLANGQTATNTLYTAALTAFGLEASFRQGGNTFAQTFEAMLKVAGPTTAVAAETYGFFTGSFPSLAGQTYLVNSVANTQDLTDPYYYGFNQASRFENFSVNLGTGTGAGAATFALAYGSLTFDQAVRKAYDVVIGNGNAILAGINLTTAIAYVDSQQSYFQAIGGSDIGAKAAMAGYLMSAGFDARLGNYYGATHDLLAGDITVNGQPAGAGQVNLVGQALTH